eukprot:6178757-Pleurochrysis_carterae.AAC.1
MLEYNFDLSDCHLTAYSYGAEIARYLHIKDIASINYRASLQHDALPSFCYELEAFELNEARVAIDQIARNIKPAAVSARNGRCLERQMISPAYSIERCQSHVTVHTILTPKFSNSLKKRSAPGNPSHDKELRKLPNREDKHQSSPPCRLAEAVCAGPSWAFKKQATLQRRCANR